MSGTTRGAGTGVWRRIVAVAASIAWTSITPAVHAAGAVAPSGAQWGAPAAPANASSAAVEEDDDRANGEYFHDFAALMVRVRSVGWLADICSEAFPGNADLEKHAYDDWLHAHRKFIDEMEGQFALIDRRWAAAAPAAAAHGITTAALQARLDANRAALREDFLARAVGVQRKRCDAYPTLLLARQLDLEHAQADLVRSVRQGPPAP